MPRPPIGERAMTDAERQRRRRDRLRKDGKLRQTEKRRSLAEPQITPDVLSMSAQQRLEAAIRQEKRRLDAEYAARLRAVDEEVRLRVIEENKDYLAMMKAREKEANETIALYREVTNNHKPLFTADQFKTILMCLHPDGQRTAEKLADAFRLFNGKKLQLTGAR